LYADYNNIGLYNLGLIYLSVVLRIRIRNEGAVRRRNATYFFTFHTISDRNTACKEIRRNEHASGA